MTTHEVTGRFVLEPLLGVLLGIVIMAGVFGFYVVMRKRMRERFSPVEVAGIFEVSVTVPSAGKTVTLEVAPDHTAGSLVETIVSTLKLPKGRTYAIEYRGKLVSRPDFGESLEAFQIKEGSKLSLRVVD